MSSKFIPLSTDNGQHNFPCIQCGSQLDFQPGTLEMQCTHCGNRHRIKISNEPVLEVDYYQTLAFLPAAKPDAVHSVVQCEACGATTDFDRNIHADECPFCGTKLVLDTTESRVIQPKSLLPFAVTSDEAKSFYKAWLKKRWFAPNKLKKYAKQDQHLNGVYVPYWTYDCACTSDYVGERGDVYYVRQRVRVRINGRWTTQEQQVPKIRWSSANGRVQNHFDETLVYASDTLTPAVAKELEPWDLPNLRPYQHEFLSGFRSELYHIDIDDGFDAAQKRIHPTIRQSIRRAIGGDKQRIHQIRTQYSDVSFKHLLLPYWIAGFRFHRKTYQFIVNGRTGEVQGDRPWSYIKIALALLGIVALVVLFMTFAGQSSGGFEQRPEIFNPFETNWTR
ncbi:MAG: hypothetical protein V3V09_08595 [Arenicellales bacterium]